MNRAQEKVFAASVLIIIAGITSFLRAFFLPILKEPMTAP